MKKKISKSMISTKNSRKELITKKIGFTLAEVLITLGVIGIVAAMTLPTLLNTLHKKSTETKQQVFRARLLNGLKETTVQSTLMGYESTMDFAKALGQHYKMFNLCDTNNIKACYSIEEVVLNDEGETLAVEDIKKAKNLSLEEDDGWLDPVAMVATDGTIFIMSYNKDCKITEAELQTKDDDKTALQCINGVIDINGVSAPNKQGKDILPFNGATVGLTKSAPTVAWTTVTSNSKTYKVSPQLTAADGFMPNGETSNFVTYADAQSACAAIGGHIPSVYEMIQISNYPNRNEWHRVNSYANFWTEFGWAGPDEANYMNYYSYEFGLAPESNRNAVVCIAD